MRRRHAVAVLAGLLSGAATLAPANDHVGWTWPLGYVQPAVVRAFDPPAEPWRAGHRGVDLAAIDGEAVYAAGPGVVTYAGLVAGVGVVSVSHGALRTTYQPVIATVRAGEHVRAGEQIGTVDVTGSHCAPSPCLHWGLRRGDVYLDPTSLVPPMERPRARLLPLGPAALGEHATRDRRDVGRLTVDHYRAQSAGDAATNANVAAQAAMGALAGIASR